MASTARGQLALATSGGDRIERKGGRKKILVGQVTRYTVVGDEGTESDLATIKRCTRTQFAVSDIFRRALRVYAVVLEASCTGARIYIQRGCEQREIFVA